MIRLTQRGSGRLFLVAPDKITSSGSYMHPIDGSDVHYVTYADDGDGVEIREDPLDVARLIAAWGQRFNASELYDTLPIAVFLDVTTPDKPVIQFQCCWITQQIKAEKAAAFAAADAEREAARKLPFWKRWRAWWAD